MNDLTDIEVLKIYEVEMTKDNSYLKDEKGVKTLEAVAKKSKEKLPARYQVVVDILPTGSDKAIILDDIMIIADIKDKRDAYTIIHDLIVKYGYPIAASKTGRKGYYFPISQTELNQAAYTLKNSYESLKKRHDALKNNYKEYQNKNNIT